MQVTITRENRSLFMEVLITAMTMAAIGCYVFAHLTIIAVFLGLGAIVLASLYYDDYDYAVLFMMDNEGIFDARLGVGKIPWSEITSAQLELCYHTRFLCLGVRNPEKFLMNVPPHLRHKFKQNHDLGFTGFNIDISGINISPLQLKEIVEAKIA